MPSVAEARISEAYAARAERYIAMFGAGEHMHPDDLDLLCRHLGCRSGPVLDLGCGPGHLTSYLHGLGVAVMGVDLVPEFIRHARSTHPAVAFEVGSLETLGRPDHAWDAILAWYSLIHVAPARLDHALAGLRRATAPGGTVVVGFVDGEVVAPFEHKVLTAYTWPVDEFARRLANAGFVETERLQRDADGDTRRHAAIAARAT